MTDTMITLDDLVARLRAAHGDALVAVALYGSTAVAAEAAPGDTHDVLVVVRALTPAGLHAAGPVARAWAEAGHPPPMTLTEHEWRGSADIFPMEYADILERHRVLHGQLPLEGIAVRPSDLRLQLEREAMGKLLRLRQAVLIAEGNPARQVALLADSFGAIKVLFRAALHLVGEPAPREADALVRAAAGRAGFDPAPFATVAAHRRGTAPIPPARAGEVLLAYHAGIERLVRWLDALPAGGSGPAAG